MKQLLYRWLPLAAGIALAVATLQLGNWQTRRAEQKTELQAAQTERAGHGAIAWRADAAVPAEWQPVRLSGRWLEEASVFLDNRTHGGRAGYHVLTPLQLADGSGAVLVNRGWVAAPAARSQLPAVATPAGAVTVEGAVHLPERAPFSLSGEVVQGRVWQHVEPAAYRQATGMTVAAWTVLQTSAAADGLVREWPRPDAGVARHRGYAVQWYAFALLAAGLSAWYAWRNWGWSGHERRTTH